MNQTTISKMFNRRIFSMGERESLDRVYVRAQILAERIVETVPAGVERDLAIYKLKEVLAFCEASVAMNPVEDKQGFLNIKSPPWTGETENGYAEKKLNADQRMLDSEMEKPAYVRR